MGGRRKQIKNMKHKLILLMSVMLLLVMGMASAEFYWRFDDDTTDDLGNHDLDTQNRGFLTGIQGNAIDLENGNVDYARNITAVGAEVGAIGCLSFWVKPESIIANIRIIEVGDGTTANYFTLFMEADGTIGTFLIEGSGTAWQLFPTTVLVAGSWTHIMFSFGSEGAKIYFDGDTTPDDTDANTSGFLSGYTNIWIGERREGSPSWDGLIDNVYFTESQCTTENVTAWYNGGAGVDHNPDTTPPVIQLGVNNTSPKYGEDINISFNVTDDTAPTFVNVTINFTTGLVIYNYTVSADIDLHNITTITDTRGNVLNISVCAIDAADNYGCESTKITVVNSVPTPIIILPTPNDYNNTQPSYPFKITYPADGDGDSITTVKYYINGIINQTISPVTNTTFNASDGYYILNVSLFDGIDWSTNATVNFTIDTTVPTLLLFNLTNNTRFGFNVNATMNITMEDTNPFLLKFNLHNTSIANIENGSSIALSTSTTITIINTLNLSGLASGNYTLDINFSDRSTVFAIKNYGISPMLDGVNFRTDEGNNIDIVQTLGVFTEIKTTKLTDRYTFGFGKTKKREQRKYLVIANNPIHIPKHQDHKGHLIVSKGIGGNWISFDNNDKGSEVSVVRLGKNIVEVIVYSYDFNFQSIGGLNVINVFYNFQVDNDVPIVTSSINNTSPFTNDIVNISANATDIIAISTLIIGHNNSGTWENVSNSTVAGDITNTINLDYLLTITADEGQTIGTMACANDTFNQFTCGSVLTMQVNDTTVPTIVTGNNATRFLIGQNINFTYNVTDNFKLSMGQIIITNNSVTSYFNFSLTGTSKEFSKIFIISGSLGQTINVTGRVNDSFNNFAQVTTLFSVTKDLVVNASNIYDNTTILSFTAILYNDTFSETQTTTDGNVSFNDVIDGTYTLNISSDENGGYHNATYTIDASNDFEARLHQAIVFFTAVRRGTNDSILSFRLSVRKADNQSNATGGLKFLLNASKYTTSGTSTGFFDFPLNISVGNQSTSSFVSEFYDINVSISISSVVNDTFLHNFTIILSGIDFTETQIDTVGIDEGNLTFSLGNGSYSIIVSHPDFATSFFAFDLIGNSSYPNLTFAMLGANSINFSVFDEITQLLLPENATINMISDNAVRNFTADDGRIYVQNIEPGDYRITYFADKYTKRDYYLTIINDTNQTIDLFLLSSGNGTEVTFTVQDNSGNDLEDALIRLKRYYLSSNSYITVAMSKTNSEGETIIDVDFNDAFYETLTTFEGFSLRTIGAKIISTTLILTMDLLTDPFTTIDAIQDMTTSLSFTNSTQTFVYVFTDTSGNSRTGQLDVIKRSAASEVVVCTITDTSVSATLLCQVNTTASPGSYIALGKIIVGSNKIVTDNLERETGIARDFRNTFGTQGAFFTIIIAGTMAGLGAGISPAVAIIMFLVGLGIVNFLGFSIWGLSLYVSFVVAGAILIFKMKK